LRRLIVMAVTLLLVLSAIGVRAQQPSSSPEVSVVGDPEIVRAWDKKMPSAQGPLVRADFLELAVTLAPLIRRARRLIAHPPVEIPPTCR